MIPRLRVLAVACLGALLLTAPSPAAEQPALELEPLLAAPVTAGSEALLVRFARDPRVPMRWLGHLRHDDPLVRAVAARALAVTGVQAAIGRLRVALAAESDPGAAVEQALGLLLLGDGAHDAYALGRLAQADDAAIERGLLILASVRPRTLPSQLTALGTAHAHRPLPVGAALARLDATRHQDVFKAYETAVTAAGDATAVETLLRVALARDVVLDEATLALALSGRTTPSRLTTLAEYVAVRHSRPGAPRDDTDYGALVDKDWPVAQAARDDAVVLAELVRRWAIPRHTPMPDLPLRRVSAYAHAWSTRLMRVLTAAEQESLREHLKSHERAFGQNGPRSEPGRPVWHPVALLSALPHGLVGNLRAATGCTAEDRHERVVEVTYRPDGRASAASIPTGARRMQLPPGCETMAETMALLAYEPTGPAHPGTRLLFTRLDDAFAQCHDLRPVVRGELPGDDAELTPPELQKAGGLTYPEKAVDRRDRGVVQMELHLTTTGCVAGGWVTGPVTLQLDAAAMKAASRWHFTPARRGQRGVPARVFMAAHFWLQ
jgi:TonB family protein